MDNLLIPIAVITIIGLIAIVIYNRLVKSRNQIENAISSLDALFIKRCDLIPGLVQTTQEYMKFEDETLEKITILRSVNATTPPEAEKEMSGALKSLFFQAENYPDLKTNQQFLNLQYSLNEIEEQISASRRYVATAITEYNNTVGTFPNSIIASLSKFKKFEWVYADEKQKATTDIKSLFNK